MDSGEFRLKASMYEERRPRNRTKRSSRAVTVQWLKDSNGLNRLRVHCKRSKEKKAFKRATWVTPGNFLESSPFLTVIRFYYPFFVTPIQRNQ